MLSKEDVIALIKETLSVEVNLREINDFYSSGIKAEVILKLDGEVISTSYDTITLNTSNSDRF